MTQCRELQRLAAVRYSTNFNGHPFVCTTEPSIVEKSDPSSPRTTIFLIGKVYVFLARPDLYLSACVPLPVEVTAHWRPQMSPMAVPVPVVYDSSPAILPVEINRS